MCKSRKWWFQDCWIANKLCWNINIAETLCDKDLLCEGFWRKDLANNHGTLLRKRAVAGGQDVHSQEIYHFIRYVYLFRKNTPRTTTYFDAFKPDCWRTVGQVWNDPSKAWNNLSSAWSADSIFSATNFWIPSFPSPPENKGQKTLGFNLDTLDGTRIKSLDPPLPRKKW